ncbi:MAG: hypothetical protein ACAH80_08845 [Alphaproteobacteria bacterium]
MGVPKVFTASLLLAFGVVAGIGISEYRYKQQQEQDPQKQELVEKKESGKQIVKTIFVGEKYENGPVELTPYQHPVHTAEVTGNFPASQAYRYNIVFTRSNDRNANQLVSFTAGYDMTAQMNNRYRTYRLDIPAHAEVSSLPSLTPEARAGLTAAFHALDTKENIGALPTGLADPASYMKPGFDGYAFRYWSDAMNGGGGFRDVTGVYPPEGGKPSTKVLTEAVINADGRVCQVQGDNRGDYEEWKAFKHSCQRIETMKPDELQALKDRAAALGVPLVDETIHTYVRDAAGKTVAQDVTQSLLPGPVNLRGHWDYNPDAPTTRAEAVDSYVFMTLDAKGRVALVLEASFPKGTFKPGEVPEIKKTGGTEYKKNTDAFGYGRAEYDVGGYMVLGDTDPTGYEIRYTNDRFAQHGKPSKLPRNQVNQFGG